MAILVAGSTSPKRFQLLQAGAPIDLSGLTVTLQLEDETGASVSSFTLSIVNAVSGLVDVYPTTTSTLDASKSPYYARWKLVDSSGGIAYVPDDFRDIWTIRAT